MFNFILSIVIFPLVPFFLYGHVADTSAFTSAHQDPAVLGESDVKGSYAQGAFDQNHGELFPLDFPAQVGYTPIRKPGYDDIKVWAGSSVVIDVDSRTILEYDNGRKQTQIASLTKLMTATLTVESVKDLDESVTITKDALDVDGTTVGCPTSVFCNSNRMYVGEKISARSLLTAMLLDSANDAATALGIHIAGSPDKFVGMMNRKAKDLGLKDTHFCTPSGLEIDGHESECYSSAYDIARIAANSLKYDLIWNIMKIDEAQVFSADGKYMHQLKNTDLLLSQLPNCIGGKTGFTPMAGKSLLMAAYDPSKKHRVVAVLLNDEDRWMDMSALIDWVFKNYAWR
jgi:D-alanyl-D-alanine carboxypeptidase